MRAVSRQASRSVSDAAQALPPFDSGGVAPGTATRVMVWQPFAISAHQTTTAVA